MSSDVVDLSSWRFDPLGEGKFRIKSIDLKTVERLTAGFVKDSPCTVRNGKRLFVAVEIISPFAGRYDLTVIEWRLEVVSRS